MDKTERVEKLENILKKIFLRAFPKLEKACQGCGISSTLATARKVRELCTYNSAFAEYLAEYQEL